MLQFRNITGTKTVKGATEEAIIATSTQGDFKITKLMQDKLGIKDGDFGLVVVDDESGAVYFGKGINGTPLLNEDGTEQKDARGRGIFAEDAPGFGAVIRRATPNSPNLKLTAASAWLALGCNDQENVYFQVGEGVEGQVPTEDGGVHTTLFFKLEEYKRKAKAERKSADGTTNVDSDDENEELEEGADFEEEV